MQDAFLVATLTPASLEETASREETVGNIEEEKVTEPAKKDRISLKEIDDRLMTIDDFLN